MNKKLDPSEEELRSIQSRLLEIASGRERSIAGQIFGWVVGWCLRLGVSEKVMADKVFTVARALDKETLDG